MRPILMLPGSWQTSNDSINSEIWPILFSWKVELKAHKAFDEFWEPASFEVASKPAGLKWFNKFWDLTNFPTIHRHSFDSFLTNQLKFVHMESRWIDEWTIVRTRLCWADYRPTASFKMFQGQLYHVLPWGCGNRSTLICQNWSHHWYVARWFSVVRGRVQGSVYLALQRSTVRACLVYHHDVRKAIAQITLMHDG